jgi:excisionase family DNA binding protein
MSPKIIEAERAYTIIELAALKQVSPDYIRAAIKATKGNTLAAKKVGRGYRISASAAEAWWNGLADA